MCLDLSEAARSSRSLSGQGWWWVDMHKRYDPDHLKILGSWDRSWATPITRGACWRSRWKWRRRPSVVNSSTRSLRGDPLADLCSCTT